MKNFLVIIPCVLVSTGCCLFGGGLETEYYWGSHTLNQSQVNEIQKKCDEQYSGPSALTSERYAKERLLQVCKVDPSFSSYELAIDDANDEVSKRRAQLKFKEEAEQTCRDLVKGKTFDNSAYRVAYTMCRYDSECQKVGKVNKKALEACYRGNGLERVGKTMLQCKQLGF